MELDDGDESVFMLQEELAQTRAALEQRTRERDEARGNWNDVPLHNRLIPIAEWQRIVVERDASIGRLMDKLEATQSDLSAARAALEQRTRERDEARAQTSELLPIADAHDWALGEMQTALNRAAKAEAELSSLRASAAALVELEEWLRGADWRFMQTSMVVGEGEIHVNLDEDAASPYGSKTVAEAAENTLSAAIRSALKAAKEGTGK